MASWLTRLKRRLGKPDPVPPPTDEAGSPPVIGEHGAAHGGDDPRPLHHGRRRLKETYTNHWDLDYLPRDEVEKIAERNRRKH